MKKSTLAALVLALPLTIGSAWSAASPITYDYGKKGATINEMGTYSDSFALKGLNLDANSVITLTFNYSDVGGSYSGHNRFNSESWFVYADNSYSWSWLTDTLPAVSTALDPALSAVSIEFSSSSNANTFQSILNHQGRFDTIDFWFGETTRDAGDSFKLYSASLNVTSAVVAPTTPTAPIPEPESYALLIAGLGMLTAVARRNKQKRS